MTTSQVFRYSKESLLFQLSNVENALAKTPTESQQYLYIERQREEILEKLGECS